MRRYSPPLSISRSTTLQPSVPTASIPRPLAPAGVHKNIVRGSQSIHLQVPLSTSIYQGVITNAVRHATHVQPHRVQPIIYGPQIIPPLKTNMFHGVYTTPTLAVLSDKQIPVIGNYVSNEPRITSYLQDLNPPHVQQPIVTKVVQATIKDIIPTEIIKITSQGSREFEPRGSQIGAFDPPSIENIPSRSASVYNSQYKSSKYLGDNIKVSVYRSPDVVIKERQLITDGPKLQKQHVLRVGVQGYDVPTYRPHFQNNQIEIRDLKLDKQETVIVHEGRFAPELLPAPKNFVQASYEIKPTVTSVTLPEVSVPIPVVPRPQLPLLQDSYQRETLETINFTSPYLRTDINPIVHQTHIRADSEFTSPQIREMMTKRATPVKDLSWNAGRLDESTDRVLLRNNTADNLDRSIERHTDSFYINGNTPIGSLAYKIHEEQGPTISKNPYISSKLPQARINQPLSFNPSQFPTRTRANSSGVAIPGEREPGNYQGPPIRRNDPERKLLD